ncbi:Uncharacterised protein [Vibrio cholerae]|uniref:Uncharacterized protein n=1 Tax=Vibrio cholerae TaxID=666 RepID=A0A655Z5T8_VIBCL|nr:Uncharacterised protein [Vibrio cholerae]CSB18707.1 Uncharacterised protein [Vibrio cholerae]CSC61025.1 Uncharacterised protein [Vibrio cholerae]CSC75998.1 Uncharacterised protein [Vibrio cholerae]
MLIITFNQDMAHIALLCSRVLIQMFLVVLLRCRIINAHLRFQSISRELDIRDFYLLRASKTLGVSFVVLIDLFIAQRHFFCEVF